MKPDIQPPSPDGTVRISGKNISISELKEKLKKIGKSGKVVPYSDNLPEDWPAPSKRPDENVLPREVTREELIALVQSLPKNKISKVFEAATQIADSKLPVVAPALWKDRDEGTTAIQFFEYHYAIFIPNGLKRQHIQDLDEPLYSALSKWVSRKKKAKVSIPDALAEVFLTPSERVDAEIAEAALADPHDAFKVFADDPKKAKRIYKAAARRVAP